MIRSLKEPVKQNSVLSSLLPDQLPQSQLNSPVVKSDPHSIVFVDTGDSASDNELSLNGATPTKRPRSSTSDIPRQICSEDSLKILGKGHLIQDP